MTANRLDSRYRHDGLLGACDRIRYALPHGYRGTDFPDQPFDRNPGAAEPPPPGGRPDSRVERLTGVAYRLAWGLLRRLPQPVAYGLAAAAGELVHALVPGTRRQLRANLVPAAELKAATRRAMRSVTRSYVESFRAADLEPAELDRRTDVSGFREHVDAALDGGEGLIVLLAHHGSWDLAARWAGTHGYHLGVVAEVLRPHHLFRRFVRLREAMGLEVVPLPRAGDKGRDAVTQAAAAGPRGQLHGGPADGHAASRARRSRGSPARGGLYAQPHLAVDLAGVEQLEAVDPEHDCAQSPTVLAHLRPPRS